MSSPTVSTKLARIAEQSKRDATWVFTTLAHLMDEDFLTEAFHQLRKDAAAGIDETVSAYLAFEAIRKSLDDQFPGGLRDDGIELRTRFLLQLLNDRFFHYRFSIRAL